MIRLLRLEKRVITTSVVGGVERVVSNSGISLNSRLVDNSVDCSTGAGESNNNGNDNTDNDSGT